MQSWRLAESDLFSWKLELTLVPRVFLFSNMATWYWHRHIEKREDLGTRLRTTQPSLQDLFRVNYKKASSKNKDVESVFTHLSGGYANLLEQKKVFTYEKGWTCTVLIWKTNMTAVSLFWNTNIAGMVTSCKNTLFTVCTRLRKQPIFGDVTTGFPAK